MSLENITALTLENKLVLYEDLKRNGPLVIADSIDEIISLFDNSYKIFTKTEIEYTPTPDLKGDNSCYKITKINYQKDNSQLPYKGFYIRKEKYKNDEKYVGTTHYFNVKDNNVLEHKYNMNKLVINKTNFVCYIGSLYTGDDINDTK